MATQSESKDEMFLGRFQAAVNCDAAARGLVTTAFAVVALRQGP